MVPRLVIAAPASGAGKTTIATGLMAALVRRGLAVSPHKVGPDYIDPGYHALATGRPGRNLDPWLTSEDLIAPLFLHGAANADIAIIEGVMGLYDGMRGTADFASTAHVARLLEAPVILVVDATGQGQSVAALVHGFASYDTRVRLAGIILNRVGSPRHKEVCRESLESTGIPVLGAIPRTPDATTPSRHLGLIPAAERHTEATTTIPALATLIESTCDLPALVALAHRAAPIPATAWNPQDAVATTANVKGAGGKAPASVGQGDTTGDGEGLASGPAPVSVGQGEATADGEGLPGGGAAVSVGRGGATERNQGWVGGRTPVSVRQSEVTGEGWVGVDGRARRGIRPVVAIAGGAAFTFGYVEQVELLIAAGAEVATFDPVRDEDLPEGTRGVILPGGFPEVYASELSANERLRVRMAEFVTSGGAVVAECAGLLYLSRELDDHPMCGILDAKAEMSGRLTLGYRDAVAVQDSVLTRAGERYRGHEFHRTVCTPPDSPVWRWIDGGDGYASGRVLASYLHLHWAGSPVLAARFVGECR
ncbi:cobyrinate a,c-diamide synthase [Acrocarpospora pleiomorpha]|nr:cobyrinate a,c-diamide synthase [Acrocarpospora pleiomorpha]